MKNGLMISHVLYPNYRKRELSIIKCILMLTININSDKT